MYRLWRRWRKEFGRRLTIMVVPHGIARPRQISFSVPFIVYLFTLWTGLTSWAGFLASQQFDYWRAKANAHFLRLKVDYFSGQLTQSRAMLDEVKQLEGELRTLIGLGSRDAIIQAENSPQPLEGTSNQGTGGPSLADAQALQSLLEGKTRDMSFEEISKEIQDLRAEAEVRLASVQSLSQRITEERALFRSTPNIWPTNGYLTSHFGPRLSPTHGFEENHKGMDIAGPAGSPVRVTADGVVKLARWAGGYGKVVVVDHGFGYSTRYGHNRQLLVQAGERVRRGQIVALMGETGNATGPHCHYEVWYNGRAVNPGKFLKRPSS